jgi:hypothetical protein
VRDRGCGFIAIYHDYWFFHTDSLKTGLKPVYFLSLQVYLY